MQNGQLASVFASLPVRPVRLIRTFAMGALMRVPLYCLAAGLALFYAAQVMASELGTSIVGTVGTWSFTIALTTLGVVLGLVAGLAAAGEGVLRATEADVRDWLRRISSREGDRLVPSIDLEQLRSGQDAVVQFIYRNTMGRIPLPGFARHRIQRQLRHALLDEFVAECEQQGVTRVGFAEIRDFWLQRVLPIATRPVLAPLTLCSALFLTLLATSVAMPLLVAMLTD